MRSCTYGKSGAVMFSHPAPRTNSLPSALMTESPRNVTPPCYGRAMGRVRVRSAFECGECGQQMAQWAGRCPGCGAWGSIAERTASSRPSPRSPGASTVAPLLITDRKDQRVLTGVAGVDRVLGGGLVPASVTLLAGEPGIGKSTLLLQVAA